MKTKKEWLKLWENAPISQFINFSALDAGELKKDGLKVTDDWARAMYLFQVYSGGGYASAFLGITSFWRALRCRYNVPYGEKIGNLFFEEQLYTFHHNRDIPTLLNKISRIVGNDHLDKNGELSSILDVIKEKTGFPLKEYIKSIPTTSLDVEIELQGHSFQSNLSNATKRMF